MPRAYLVEVENEVAFGRLPSTAAGLIPADDVGGEGADFLVGGFPDWRMPARGSEEGLHAAVLQHLLFEMLDRQRVVTGSDWKRVYRVEGQLAEAAVAGVYRRWNRWSTGRSAITTVGTAAVLVRLRERSFDGSRDGASDDPMPSFFETFHELVHKADYQSGVSSRRWA